MKRTAAALLALMLLLTACGRPAEAPPPIDVVQPTDEPTPEPTPEPTTEPTPEPTPDPVAEIVAAMSDAELAGQLVMGGVGRGESVSAVAAKLLTDGCMGGAILFGWNTISFPQGAAFTAEINALSRARVPMMIAVDLEGGKVCRFPEWEGVLKSPSKLAAAGDTAAAVRQFREIGEKLRELGFTVDLAPVADIAHDPAASFMASRIFGADADTASAMTAAVIQGLHEGGMAACCKHFPGVAETGDDPHKAIPVINATLGELENYYFVPFRAAIEAGCDMMLVTHVIIPAIDPDNLASLSEAVITGELREKMGFDGVIIIDDLRMDAVELTMDEPDAAVAFILAGGDIVMAGEDTLAVEVLDRLVEAMATGELTRERIEESAYRIVAMKLGYA